MSRRERGVRENRNLSQFIGINWANPLARAAGGLTDAYLADPTGRLINLGTGDNAAIVAGAVIANSELGRIGETVGSGSAFAAGNPAHGASMSVVAKLKRNAGGAFAQIVTGDQSGSGLRDFQFRFDTSDNINFIPFVSGSNGSVTGTAVVASGDTATVGFSHNGDGSSSNIRVYCNGVLDGTGSKAGALDSDLPELDVGARFDGGTYQESSSHEYQVVLIWRNGYLTDLQQFHVARDPLALLLRRGNLRLVPSGATVALTGTALDTIDEDDITTGGKTIIITLTGDTFKAAGTGPIGSTADTQALIDGFDAASSPTNGWNNEVRDKAATTEVVRTSSTVATWTIAAQAGYDISAQETITGTIPTDVLVTGAGAITATPTFTVDEAAAGRIMSSLANHGGLAGMGGIAGQGGGLAG